MPPLRFIINEYIEMVLENRKPVIYIAGKPVAYCSFLVVTLPEKDAKNINSIDELAAMPGANTLEEQNDLAKYGITVEENFWGHCSSIQNWAENGYNTSMIASNLSFPLLKTLARAGDPTANRVIQWEIEDRLDAGFTKTTLAILETCSDIMDEKSWFKAASSSDPIVRFTVARHVDAPPRVLEILSKDDNFLVRQYVAGNPTTPPSALASLVNDGDLRSRIFLASNPNTPGHVLEILGADHDNTVRFGVSRNRSAPAQTLKKLSKDKEFNVRIGVAENTNTPPEVLGTLDREVLSEAARNPICPAQLLEKLSKDKDMRVRDNVARHPNTPVAVLRVLATDIDHYVRFGVISNNKTPKDVLEFMAMQDRDVNVRNRAKEVLEIRYLDYCASL